MGQGRKFFFAVAVFGLGTLTAIAAELPEFDHSDDMIPDMSQWYLRGDIGWAVEIDSDPHLGRSSLGDGETRESWAISGGVGRKHTSRLRSDVTVGYLDDVRIQATAPCICGVSQQIGTLSALTALANVYLDAGSWHGFSPYLGAGIGAARLSAGPHLSLNPGIDNDLYGRKSTWNLAFALMAGTAYALSDQWHLDFGYRYLWLGSAPILRETGGTPGTVDYGTIAVHELRLGLRVLIN